MRKVVRLIMIVFSVSVITLSIYSCCPDQDECNDECTDDYKSCAGRAGCASKLSDCQADCAEAQMGCL